MTKLLKEITRNGVINWTSTKKIHSLVAAGKNTFGTKAIQAILDGNSDHLSDEVWYNVKNVVCKNTTDGLLQTADCQKQIKIYNHARSNQLMMGITADTGMGKTFVSQAIALVENTFLVEVDLSTTPRAFINNLLRDMGIWFDGSLADKLDRIAKEINKLNEPLLIIDEAGKISDSLMLCLHTLRDRTKDRCGIVLIGMPELKNRLIWGKEKGKKGYAEFFRRVNHWEELKGLQDKEIAMVLERSGVTDPDTQKEFRKCKQFGDLVNAINLFKLQLNS